MGLLQQNDWGTARWIDYPGQAGNQDIKTAFNTHFYDTSLRRYTAEGNGGTTGAPQTAQALALDAGLVPDGERPAVLNALVELVYAFHPNGDGPHFSGGTIGMASTVRALSAGGRDEVLWDLLQEDDQPSYGYFMQPTTANPHGMTTIGERWNLGDSKNHMILAQIEEWFHTGLAGIRVNGARSVLIQPKVVGDLTQVSGSYQTAQGTVRSEWSKTDRSFRLTVRVPANTTAEIWVPAYAGTVLKPGRAEFLRSESGYSVYRTGSGAFTFTVT